VILFVFDNILPIYRTNSSETVSFCHERGEKTALKVDNSITKKNKNQESRRMQALHIVSEEPSKTLEKLEESYQALRTHILQLEANKSSFQEHEEKITHFVHEIGRAAIKETLSRYDIRSARIHVGTQIYRHRTSAPKEYQTPFGSILLERQMYVNRKNDGNGLSICPLELQAGIIEGYWTPLAAQQAMWALSHLTPRETEAMLFRFKGMNPSRSSLDRLPKAINELWEPQTVSYHTQLIHEEGIPKEATSCAVSLDGVMVGMKPNTTLLGESIKGTQWKEASCGTVSFFDALGERISTIQYGRMPEHKKFTQKTLLRLHTEHIMQHRPDLQLVHIADGAQDNWTFFDEYMPLGFQVTDFYHASQYLKEAFNAAYLKEPNKAVSKFKQYQTILRDEINGINKVMRALRYLRDQHKGNQAIVTCLTYFTNNQHRMRYALAKQNNLPIGSGIVEAACKTLVGQRLKRAGMSWSFDGAQGVLTMRSLAKSDRFDKAWPFIANHYKHKVTPYKSLQLVG